MLQKLTGHYLGCGPKILQSNLKYLTEDNINKSCVIHSKVKDVACNDCCLTNQLWFLHCCHGCGRLSWLLSVAMDTELLTGVVVFQASGVSVQPSCVQAFNDIKLGHKYRYIIYSLTDDLREIRVLKAAAPCEY